MYRRKPKKPLTLGQPEKKQRGGYREGGGRPKGSKNLKDLKMNQAFAKALARAKPKDGPLTARIFLETMYRDEALDPELRKWAVAKILPYEEHVLKAIELTGPGGGPIEHSFTAVREELESRLTKRDEPRPGKKVSGKG